MFYKVLFAIALFTFSASTGWSKIVDVEVPATNIGDLAVINIDQVNLVGGCANSTVELSVVQSATTGVFVVNTLLSGQTVVGENPTSGCASKLVSETLTAAFAVWQANTVVQLDVPEDVMPESISVTIQTMPMAHPKF